jgi:flagellar biosynthesis protein FliR
VVWSTLADPVTALLWTWALLVARIAPLVIMVPAFGGLRLVASVRGGVILALSVALWPVTLVSMPSAIAERVHMFGSQLAVGLLAGSAVLVLAESARTFGGLADTALGRGSMGPGDPLTNGPSSAFSSFFALAWTALFVSSGAHLALLAGAHASLTTLPLGTIIGAGALASQTMLVVDCLVAAFELAVALALPAFAVSWIVDLILGWLNRAFPSLPAMFLAMPIRAVLGWLVVAMMLGPIVIATTELVSVVLPRLWGP